MNNEVIKLAEEFAQEITMCNEYKKFMKADKTLKNSQESFVLINDFSRKQRELKYNGYSEKIINELKDLQERVNNNKIVQDVVRTQAELVSLLRETNDIISEEIDSPFAFSKGGGCCG